MAALRRPPAPSPVLAALARLARSSIAAAPRFILSVLVANCTAEGQIHQNAGNGGVMSAGSVGPRREHVNHGTSGKGKAGRGWYLRTARSPARPETEHPCSAVPLQ